LAFGRLCRAILNGEQVAPGILAKRCGITTAVTVDLVIGTLPPFRPIRWKIGNAPYLVAVGSDADAFLNPHNNWLYARAPTFPTGRIYSGPTTILKEPWGIAKPTVIGIATRDGHTPSKFGTSGLLYAVTGWSEARKCESEPVFLLGEGCPDLGDDFDTTELVYVPGMGWSVSLPAVSLPAGATTIRYYRERMISVQGSAKTGYVFSFPGDASHLRFIDEKADGAAWIDSGGQALSRLLDYCYDVVPWASRSAAFKDGWLYLTTSAETPCAYKLIRSNPMCPETYAGNMKSVFAETDAGLMQGKSEWAIPTDCGLPIGLAVQGDRALILCEHGAWPFVDGPASGLYTLMGHTWVGCVSAATIAHSPEGTWWLAKEGIVLWRGGDTQPEVITLDTLDTQGVYTHFAADLSGAMGAYDAARHEYKVVIPNYYGGQFLLTVRGDRLPNEIVFAKWESPVNFPTITGMGYDWYLDKTVYFFGTYDALTGKVENPSAWAEGLITLPYPFTVEEWWGEVGGHTPETKRSVAVRIFVHRTNTTTAQTVSVTIQALRTTEEPTPPTAVDVTWGIGEVEPKIVEPPGDILGRMVKVTLTNTDVYPLEFRCIQIGAAADIRAAEGVT
jgi:hypothetical protein